MASSWTTFPILKIWFLLSSLLLCYVLCTLDNNLLSDCNVKPSPRHRRYLTGKDEIRDQLVVSTLDGHVTALDLTEGGKMLWKHPTGSVGLFTSSMSKLKLTSNGQVFRLVPSLDGSLYRFNGQALERLPMNADTLLKNSFGLADDIVITGGKENRVFGVNLATGELRYSSVMDGSFKTDGEVEGSEDILVIHRVSHTVRAVELHSGNERWNFSVGEHSLSFQEGLVHGCRQGHTKPVEDALLEEVHDFTEFDSKDHNFHVHAKDGFVGASDGRKFTWSHKFDSPIVHAWHLKNGKLENIDLFELPSLQDDGSDSAACIQKLAPADMYFGVHQEEYYIQHSPSMKSKLQDPKMLDQQNLGNTKLPRIEFKPYLLTGPSRTPHVNIGKQTPSQVGSHEGDVTTAVALKQDYLDYPYDAGMYLYTNSNLKMISVENETCGHAEDKVIDLDDDNFDEGTFIIITSLWHWWKEVLFISIATSIVVNLFLTPIFLKRLKRKLLQENSGSLVTALEVQMNASKSLSMKATEQPEVPSADSGISSISSFLFDQSFVSRYLTDFAPIQRLGKGGFGVVFQARNIIDDCEYAIKRISLPNREDAREKVMREVKALAKLDHPGIVRYFNAWQECPPPGWQEHLDQQWEASGHPSITTPSSFPSPSASSKPLSPVQNPLINEFNPFSPFDFSLTSTQTNNGKADRSSTEESGSYSFENKHRTKIMNTNESSFEIVFQQSQEGNNNESSSRSELLKPTSKNSVLHGEDSGCADRSHSTENEFVDGSGSWTTNSHRKPNRPSKLDLASPQQQQLPQAGLPPPKLYLYIQMQLCRKETLKDWLVANAVREREVVLDTFDQILCAVQYVHDCNLMHRDLKPSNIFFSFDGTVKIGDFGLVTALSESDARTPSHHQTDKSIDVVESPKGTFNKHTDQVGTQLYMSPEQVAGQPYSHKVDVYSLGLIFFELLVPFPTQMERIKVIMNLKNHIFPKGFKKEFSSECVFVQQLLSKDPNDRPSVLEMRKHPLFVPYQPHPPRRRTISQRFSSSGSECDPGTPTPLEDCAVLNTVSASS